ncbi:MAG: helix-turn-helix transcriptional regulator [Microcoleus sp. SIO2G3]|nr:helix-turn-helix transcriptional regulator [Microcoleus sp. SIO2G3]
MKALRLKRGFSQSALARAIGATEKAVRNWENDGAIPSFDKAYLLSKILNVSLDELAHEFNLDSEQQKETHPNSQ